MHAQPMAGRGLAFGLLLFTLTVAGHAATAPEGKRTISLKGYKTTRTAQTTNVVKSAAAEVKPAAYLGVNVERAAAGGLQVAGVGLDSPAAKAGITAGDTLVNIDGREFADGTALREWLQARRPGETVAVALQRGGQAVNVSATLGAVSRPMQFDGQRAVIGVRFGPALESGGLPITSVTTNGPAARAGLKPGDILLRADGDELGEALSLSDALAGRKPGDVVKFLVRTRDGQEGERRIALARDAAAASALPEDWRPLTPWKKDVFRIAVLLVEFADVKHNPAVPREEWEKAYFSRGTYNTTNATGQKTYGSMADYYEEQSCGRLRIEGRAFDWVQVAHNRADYNQNRGGTLRTGFFSNIVAAVELRDGTNALSGFDGLAIVYAGERFPTATRGSLLWAHRSSVTVKGKSWSYVIVAEGGKRMASISTMCHETGHSLGLPDLYARPENPGSEGAGTWCAMSNQSPSGRPQHFSAWCKEQLGWLTPVVIDPAVKQKLILGPIEGSTNECFKVLLRPDGAEYLLLENRRKQGFDASLADEGLLIWRVVANRPILEEAHGVSGPPGPRVFLKSVPYPSRANDSFTPYTTPSSRPQLGGGHAPFITNIRQLSDGRVTFHIGYEYD